MQIADAQREVRTVYLGGFVGQLVSAVVWAAAAVVAGQVSLTAGAWALFFGGMLIFPGVQTTLKLMGRPASLSEENPLRFLAMQIAFTVPIMAPVAAGAAFAKPEWFFPAFMIIVGAHYLPFAFLYGMNLFLPLAALLVGGGLMIGMYQPSASIPGAYTTAVVLAVFAFLGRAYVRKEAAA